MTPTVSDQELSRVAAWKSWKFAKGSRLAWAVDFAQERLDQLPPGRLLDLDLELLIFLKYGSGLWPRGGVIRLERQGPGGPVVRRRIGETQQFTRPTEDDLRATQTAWVRMITMMLDSGEGTLGDYQVHLDFSGGDGRATVREYLKPASVPHEATYALARLLLELDHDLREAGYQGPLIKACPAPKIRGAAEDPCGRWFVGRPNQRYCSSQCQNRAATRATRARASTKAPERKRGTRKQPATRKG
jgi:hypothetical protein